MGIEDVTPPDQIITPREEDVEIQDIRPYSESFNITEEEWLESERSRIWHQKAIVRTIINIRKAEEAAGNDDALSAVKLLIRALSFEVGLKQPRGTD